MDLRESQPPIRRPPSPGRTAASARPARYIGTSVPTCVSQPSLLSQEFCSDVQACWVAGTGRPKAELTLSDEERAALEGWVRRRSAPQAWALRCRIILACATGASNKDVAAQLGSTAHAVGRWRLRFVEHRIAGLGDMP